MKQKDAILSVLIALSFKLFSIEGREALKPKPDIGEEVKKLSPATNDHTVVDGPPCSLDIQKDLPITKVAQPIYLIPDTNSYWLPNECGYLEVPRGASIELYCSKSFANASLENDSTQKIPKNTHSIRLICLQGNTFLWQREKFEFRQFICVQPPRYLVERTGAICAGTDPSAASVYRVGFNITQTRFVQTMEICHDDSTLRTHYTLHRLLPANLHFQRRVKRLNFSKAGYFKQHNMNYLYAKHNQHQQAAVLFGDQQAILPYFDNTTLFLARGHLAAKSDQIYVNQQRSTFTYFNVAPQWQSFNGGQWAQLEDEVRKFVSHSKLDVDCYTGTWGTLQLPLRGNGAKFPFYLSYDANNNGLLPVPQLYYRVLVDRVRPWRGIALIGVNNPHATLNEIQEEYLVCKDIHNVVPWLKWIRNTNLKKGYLYACEVQEFMHVVKHLPQSLAKVKQLLKGA